MRDARPRPASGPSGPHAMRSAKSGAHHARAHPRIQSQAGAPEAAAVRIPHWRVWAPAPPRLQGAGARQRRGTRRRSKRRLQRTTAPAPPGGSAGSARGMRSTQPLAPLPPFVRSCPSVVPRAGLQSPCPKQGRKYKNVPGVFSRLLESAAVTVVNALHGQNEALL